MWQDTGREWVHLMIFKYSEIELGKPKMPTEWSNELQKSVELDPKKCFIGDIRYSNYHNFRCGDWELRSKVLSSITFEADSLEQDSIFFHRNYMDYLENCWGSHLGIVVTPDIIWYTLLSEVASIIKASPDDFRDIFTTSSEKKRIVVPSADLVMPLDQLVSLLKEEIPTDTSMFFPDFKFTKNSVLAFQAAFSDMCSPFYNYSMMLCGFPFIKVEGTVEDWDLLKEHWYTLSKILQKKKVEWEVRVTNTLDSIVTNFDNIELWKNIFSVKKCGSGHQTIVSGWFSDLFVEVPQVRYAENYSSHISTIKYDIIGTDRNLEMSVGLFNSIQQDEFMVPSFSSITYDVTEFNKFLKK